MSIGIDWSFGIYESANTAFFLTSVSRSFSIASVIVLAAFFPACWANQNKACSLTLPRESCLARPMSSLKAL